MSVLRCRGLVVDRGGRRLIDGVSLTFAPGVLTAIVGPNGAGKSTLLRCLAGLLLPDEGEIRLDGASLSDVPGHARTRALGYVPQRFEPAWDYSVRDVLQMGADRVGFPGSQLDHAVEENELGDLLDRRWSRLSGGERARALFASVTVASPPVLLADEPGASLDIRHRYKLLGRLRAYAADRAVAVVLHDLDQAIRFCDRIIVLSDGVVAIDAPSAEAASSTVLDRVFGLTFNRIRADGPGVPLTIGTRG